jgi:inner membrane protein
MANKKEHQVAGVSVSISIEILNLLFKKLNGKDINFKEVAKSIFFAGLGGLAGGRMPDLFEPAYHYTHRKFFHSWSLGTAVGYGVYKLSLSNTLQNKKYLKVFLRGTGVSYITHLVQDSQTTIGLPVI